MLYFRWVTFHQKSGSKFVKNNSGYQPQLIPKGKTTISGIDDKIISMHARGMSLRDIEKQVKDM